jgi:hypothetical protein
MSKGGRRRPWFRIRAKKHRALEQEGCYPWVFDALTLLRFGDRKNTRHFSEPLAFRLDTAAFVSVIPEAWVSQKGLGRSLGKLSGAVPFTTATGTGGGKVARSVRVQFPMDPVGVYEFDFLVSPNLNDRDYGLISLRDVVRNFDVASEGNWTLDADGRPLEIPDWFLIPRAR